MSRVIKMSDYRYLGQEIKPKTEHGKYEGHRYVLQYDPNATDGDWWHWTVKYTQTYEYHGSASTMGAATRAAKQRIRDLVRDAYR